MRGVTLDMAIGIVGATEGETATEIGIVTEIETGTDADSRARGVLNECRHRGLVPA